MANLDELQIKISATSKDADEAIKSLVKSLDDLNNALGRLDTGKVTSFASAMNKLSNIGANTNTTSKAIKDLATNIASGFGIRSKKGIQEITEALQGLYEAEKLTRKDTSPMSADMYLASINNVQDAIKANFTYRQELDNTTKKVQEFIKAQKQSGTKIGFKYMMGDMTPEDFKRLNKDLGGILDPKHSGAEEGYRELDEFLRELQEFSGASIDTYDISQGIRDVQTYTNLAKDSVLDFNAALRQGVIDLQSIDSAADKAARVISDLYTQQEKFGATNGLGGIIEVFKQISNIQMPDLSGVADAIKATQNAASGVGSAAPNVEEVSKSMDDVSSSAQDAAANAQELSNALMNVAQSSGIDIVAEQMRDFASRILEAAQAAGLLENKQKMIEDKFYNPIDTSGEWVENNPPDDEWILNQGKAFEEAAEKAEKAGDAVAEAQSKMAGSHISADVLENVVALGEAFEKLGSKLGATGDKFIGLFKALTKPLQWAANEYIEKFEHMGETVAKFQANFKAHMAKISAFWKRTMKTFTFMLVRKAFTAVIKEVGNAIQSLAMYSNMMGTAFNTDISNMVADFQYLGRSIVSVFAPLLNMIAPIIDAIVARIATLLSYIGMLIAALGGSSSFTKAKRNVGNYAESLDKASKSAKNLTMGIDELNILADNQGGGATSPFDAWEEVEIPKWILDLGDKLKKMWDDFIRPIKAAWDKVKAYFKFAFDYMKEQVKLLAKSIWDAFIQVWNEPETIEMIANIFRIIADLMLVIGNLCKNFREAWDEVVDGASRGVQIFRGIRDIFAILIEHVRNVTWYMVRWSSELNFRPLLDSIITLLHSLYDLADFLGGVFEDVMKNVVLKYIKWLIEDGIPHLNHTIAEVLDAFDFDKIRSDLVPFEEAFERLLEHIEEGTTNAFGNLGKHIAEFANSQAFTDFMQRLADIMDLLSAEDVEKILTGIGEGILSIAEGVVNFVNSDTFMSFLESLDSWLENATSEDIAGIIKGLAIAIGMFKFSAFIGEGLAGFLKFAVIIKSFQNLGQIASSLTSLSAGLEAAGAGGASAGAGATAASGGFAAVASTAATVVAIIAAVIAVVYSLIASFGGLVGLMDRLKESADRVANTFKAVASALKLDEHIQKLKDKIQGLIDKLGNMKDFWNVIITIFEVVAHIIAVILVPAIDILVTAFTAVIDVISGVIDMIAGLGTAIVGLVEGIATGDWSKVKDGFARIGDGLVESFILPFGDVADGINGAVTGAVSGIGSWMSEDVGAEIKSVDWEKIPEDQQVGKGIADGINNSYKSAAASTESTMKETTTSLLNNGLNDATEAVDYTTTATTYNKKLMEELYGSADTADWATYGTLINTKTGESIIAESQPLTGANETAAIEGATAFTSTYSDYFASDTSMTNSFKTYGADTVAGFNEGIESGASTTQSTLVGLFMKAQATVSEQCYQLKDLISRLLKGVFDFSGIDIVTPINTIFQNITTAVTTNLNTLGAELLGNIFPTFLQTYVFPFFDVEMWQPLFDNLLQMVFVPFFEQFRAWFSEEAMTPWWDEDLLSWFEDEKWNEEIFDPLQENIQEHWDLFSSWWDTTMNEWWENQVKPWFEKALWKEQFNNILEVAKEVFDLIKEAIKERIDEAAEAVSSACEEMMSALTEVLEAVDGIMAKLEGGFGNFKGKVTFDFGGGFASGGFPTQGSLFLANEAGAELIGTIGGKTAVASNQEITGITDAVYATGNAESELLAQLITIGRQMLDKDPVVFTDKDIARMNNTGQGKLGMSIIS